MAADREHRPRFAEFFAGGGMVSAALLPDWECAFANDIDPRKCAAYGLNWGSDVLVEADVASLDSRVLRQHIDLYWASSPCQDLSVAGKGRGMEGKRSGVFKPWIELVSEAAADGCAPRLIAFENVTGLVSRRGGQDFEFVLSEFIRLGYRVGALHIDARNFVPQSRPRIFVVAVRGDVAVPTALFATSAVSDLHSSAIRSFLLNAPDLIRRNWIWWTPGPVGSSEKSLADIVEDVSVQPWFPKNQVDALLDMMSETNRKKVDELVSSGGRHVATIYKRGRPNQEGVVCQRAEVRVDGIAGCLRTPAGGSSRQTLLVVDGGLVRARLLSVRETARLMGLPDSYHMPERYNDAYRLAGDGVAVPVVRFLKSALFEPLMAAAVAKRAA